MEPLTTVILYYFQKQREKGRILLNSVKWVEKADLGGEPPPKEIRPRPFGCMKLSSQSSYRPNAGFQVILLRNMYFNPNTDYLLF